MQIGKKRLRIALTKIPEDEPLGFDGMHRRLPCETSLDQKPAVEPARSPALAPGTAEHHRPNLAARPTADRVPSNRPEATAPTSANRPYRFGRMGDDRKDLTWRTVSPPIHNRYPVIFNLFSILHQSRPRQCNAECKATS